jgi:hypothetical protein
MRQTVTGRFKTWEDAWHAQDVLMLNGFAAADIELPAQTPGMLAGIERIMGGFFTADPLTGGAPGTGPATYAPGDTVLLAVHVLDDDHASLARATLDSENALEIGTRNTPWNWAMHDDDAPREHSAIDELGLAHLAAVVRRRATAVAHAATQAATHAATQAAGHAADRPARASEAKPAAAPEATATATVLASASAPGAGAVTGGHVEVPGAPVATQPSRDAAPQIPDEFLEYEDDTPAHHRTLH